MHIFQSEQVIKLRNVQVLLGKNEWPPNSPAVKQYWIIMLGARCWNAIRNTRQNCPTLPSWRLPCYQYGMICHRSSLIRQSHQFEPDYNRVLLLVVDILNIQFKYGEGSWHSSLKRNCWRKSRAKLDSILLNIQYVCDCMFTWKSEL